MATEPRRRRCRPSHLCDEIRCPAPSLAPGPLEATRQHSSISEEEKEEPFSLLVSNSKRAACQHSSISEEEKEEPFSDAPSAVRAVLNRPWPSPVVILPEASPTGKICTLLATADNIGPPVTPEELAALEDEDGDDIYTTRYYKAAARADAATRNYIHKHGSLYMDDKFRFVIDNSAILDEIRCKNVTADEMEKKITKQEVTGRQTYLSELSLLTYNKRRKIKFELCETLLSRSFWEDRGFFVHLNFTAKRKDKKKLFFSEIEDCGQRSGEILKVRCCVPLNSVSEGGYFCCSVPRHGYRKGLDFSRCYACTQFLKHPGDGLTYSGGHDYRRKTYLF